MNILRNVFHKSERIRKLPSIGIPRYTSPENLKAFPTPKKLDAPQDQKVPLTQPL